ncbi:porin, partial [Microcoleus sp. herbarium7]
MSKFLWKGLLVSPAVLAASLVVSSTALAAEQPIEIGSATVENQSQLAGSAIEPALPETAAVTVEPVSLASKSTVETIENASAVAPVAEQAKTPENTVAAADLSETQPAVAAADLS